MFEDFTITHQRPLKKTVDSASISQSGVLVTVSRKEVIIGHLDCCHQQVELFRYFKEEMNLEFNFCYGVQEVANKDSKQSIFGIIMDSQVWCIIVSIASSQKDKIKVEIEQLKLLIIHMEQPSINLRFISNYNSQKLILRQKEPRLTQIIPDRTHIDKFTINHYNQLQLCKQGEEPTVTINEYLKSNQIFSVYQEYVYMFNQIKELTNWRNHIFFYEMLDCQKEALAEEKTYPKYIVTLPLFQDQRSLTHISIIARDEHKKVESSFILAIYQLSSGIQIVECLFENTSIINRKFFYADIIFQRQIQSSINDQILELRGVEYCLDHHTMLIGTSSGIGLGSSLTLISMPSTGSSISINRLELPDSSTFVRQCPGGLWMLCPGKLFVVQKRSKLQIYRQWMDQLQRDGRLGLGQLKGELQHILE